MSELSTIAIVYVYSFLVAYFVIKLIWKKKETLKRPPCLPALPIIGSLPYVPGFPKLSNFFHEKSKRIGKRHCFLHVQRASNSRGFDEAVTQLRGSSTAATDVKNDVFKNNRGILQHPYNDDFKTFYKLTLNILRKFGSMSSCSCIVLYNEGVYYNRKVLVKPCNILNPSVKSARSRRLSKTGEAYSSIGLTYIQKASFKMSQSLEEKEVRIIQEIVAALSVLASMCESNFRKISCLGEILARQEIFLFASAFVHEFEILPPKGQDRIEVSEKVAVSSFEARFVRRPLQDI